MSDWWLEPIDDAERRVVAARLLCPHCADAEYAEHPRMTEARRESDGTVLHRHIKGGIESCVKWDAAELIREAVADALRAAGAPR